MSIGLLAQKRVHGQLTDVDRTLFTPLHRTKYPKLSQARVARPAFASVASWTIAFSTPVLTLGLAFDECQFSAVRYCNSQHDAPTHLPTWLSTSPRSLANCSRREIGSVLDGEQVGFAVIGECSIHFHNISVELAKVFRSGGTVAHIVRNFFIAFCT